MGIMGRFLNSDAPYHRGNQSVGLRPGGSAGMAQALPRHAAPPVAAVAGSAGDADHSAFRKLAFRAGLGMLFIRVSVLPELIYSFLHVDTYLLYIVGPPAIIGAMCTGAVGRTFRHPAARMWLGFLVCMLFSLPFSSWVGGSAGAFRLYLLFSFPLLFTVGGLPVDFKEVQTTFSVIGAAGLFVIAAAGALASADSGRVEMTSASQTIGNSNDLASHLILIVPFLLFIATDRRKPSLIRYSMIPAIGWALKIILGTASRGGLVAVIVSLLFVLFRAPAKQRLAALVFSAVVAVSIPLFLGGIAKTRLSTLLSGDSADADSSADVQAEASESKESRNYLLKQSLIYTMQHPLFGVGMAQFSNFEGKTATGEGRIGNWHETHNAFTEVSSECGVPALIFFVLGIGSAFRAVNKTYGRARREGYTEIANVSFCYLLSMVGFVTSIVFLANAYRFYLPAMIGLAIALSTAAEREMSAGRLMEPVRGTGWTSPIPARPHMARL